MNKEKLREIDAIALNLKQLWSKPIMRESRRTDSAIAREAATECFHNAFDPCKIESIILKAIKESKI